VYQSKKKSNIEAMDKVAQEIFECDRCGLTADCTNKVIGEGNIDSDIVLVGEAPGKKEDETGRPFVGTAGRLLDELMETANIDRDDVFITNILKCRPPGNRKPYVGEIEACLSHLIDQLNIIKPGVITTMGNVATNVFFIRYDIEKRNMSEVHGKNYKIETRWGKSTLIPIYHPAAAVYNRNLKPELEKDMKKIYELT
jgi:DNA polymerase